MTSIPNDMAAFNATVVEEYRANGGELTTPPLQGARLLLLTTTGARTGRVSTTPLGYAEDGPGRWILFASNMGAPRHPDWLHNLLARPDDVVVELGAERFPVAVTVTEGRERDRAYARWLERAPHTADHQERAGRQIPMVIVESPRIAAAVAAEAGELLTLQRAAFVRDAQIYGDPFLPSLTQSADEIRAEILADDVVFLTAKLGQRVVGSVRGRIADGRCYLWRLMTAPDLEGQGIGSRLLAAIEAQAGSSVDRFELSTGSKSEANIALYERRGYRIVARHEESPTLTVVTMRREQPRGT